MRTICFCNSNIPWGGGELWHLNAARSLAARGWRVLLICRPEGELLRRAREHPAIIAVPLAISRFSFLNPFMRARLVRLFRRERPHALIMNLPTDLKAAGPPARAAGVPHIIYRRGSALPVRDSLLNRHLFGRVITRLIVNSEATRAQALVNNPALIPAGRISVLANGIDIPALDAALALARPLPGFADAGPERAEGQSADAAAEGSRAAPPRGRPFVIGNAGRLNRQKGQHLLLHLCRRLVDAGLDCRALIAGSGEREAELKALALELGLGERAVFCGFLPDLAPFWRSIDLFVLTSLWEGFGNVIIEAGLAQKPVFAFAVSNLPELVRGGPNGNGRLFPLPESERANCPDPAPPAGAGGGQEVQGAAQHGPDPRGPAFTDAMAAAVLELAERPDEARRMGRAGRRAALAYSQEARMDELEALLE